MPTEPTLTELAFMYSTDKLDHGYIPFYEKYLPKNPKKILEIGVKEGASIRLWQKYFPLAEIHGLDLFIEFDKPAIPNVTWWKGHQSDYYLLEQLAREDFDIIIDDGSHASRHQMMTFFGLYNGKHYFIEDLHCCDQDFWRSGLPKEMTAKYLFDNDSVYKKEFGTENKIILIHD